MTSKSDNNDPGSIPGMPAADSKSGPAKQTSKSESKSESKSTPKSSGGKTAEDVINDRRAKLAQQAENRREAARAQQSIAESTDTPVPRVTVKFEPGTGGCCFAIARHPNGRPVMHREVLQENPRGGKPVTVLVPDPLGRKHKQGRQVPIHGGSVHTMFADECAGFVAKGLATYVEGEITEDELIDEWCPKEVLKELQMI